VTFKVVSFFTNGTPYEKEIQNLKESLIRFNVPHDIRGITSLGSWEENTKHKPIFIKQMLNLYNHPVVWLDGDSVIKTYPQLFHSIDTDIAVYYKTTGPVAQRFGGGELITATMYFDNNFKAIALLDMWIEEENRQGQPEVQIIEQRALQRVIPIWRERYHGTISILPQSHCRIFDAEEDQRVIVQNQASRRFGRN
jgi:hypothetical protein